MKVHKLLAVFFAAASVMACEEDAYEFEPKGEALNAAGLVAPVNRSSLVLNSGTPTETVVVEWEEAETGLGSNPTYTFIAADRTTGSLQNPAIEILADNEGKATQLTLTQQQLDAALAEAGYAASALAELKWSVRASLPNNTSIADSFVVDIKRFGTGIGSFSLISPQNWEELVLSTANAAETVVMSWEAAEVVNADQVTYEWIAVPRGGNFDEPLIVLPSDEAGTAPQLTITQEALDAKLEELGYTDSEKVDLEWKVRATAGDFVTYSENTNKISITRMGGIVYKVYLAEPVPAGYNVYLAGDFGYFTGSNWQQPGSNPALMLQKESDLVYSITLPFPAAAATIAHKVFLAPEGGTSWANGEQAIDPATGTCVNRENRSLEYAEGLATVAAFVAKWENLDIPACPEFITFRVTVPETTPASENVYLAGSFDQVRPVLGNWNQPGTNAALKLDKVGDFTYELTIPAAAVTGNTLDYKYFLATATNPRWNGGEQQFTASNDGCEGRPNRSVVFDQSMLVEDVVVSWEGYCPF